MKVERYRILKDVFIFWRKKDKNYWSRESKVINKVRNEFGR